MPTTRRTLLTRTEVLWRLLVSLVTLYVVVRIPATLVMPELLSTVLRFSDFVAFLLFAADIVFSYQRAASRGPEARRRYLLTSLPFDGAALIGILPFIDGSPIQLLVLAKIITTLLFANRWRQQLLRGAVVMRLALFAYLLTIIIHLTTCGWIAIRVTDDPSTSETYLRSLYWSVTTLATVGYGDITPRTPSEIQYAITVMLVGYLMFGYLIGNIASVLANTDPLKLAHLQKLEQVNTFLQHHSVPSELQHRILEYYAYMWERRSARDEHEVLDQLPAGLRTEVSLFLKRDVIERVPLFEGASESLIRELANSIRPIVVTPGEYVFHAGDPAHSMYVVARGTLQVLSAEETPIGMMSDGDFFGEMALLAKRRRSASVRAVDYCDLYMLDADTLDSLLEQHKHVRERITQIALARSAGGSAESTN